MKRGAIRKYKTAATPKNTLNIIVQKPSFFYASINTGILT